MEEFSKRLVLDNLALLCESMVSRQPVVVDGITMVINQIQLEDGSGKLFNITNAKGGQFFARLDRGGCVKRSAVISWSDIK